MISNKLRVELRGLRARVFLPDGMELRHVISVRVKTNNGEIPALTLELADFEIDAQIDVAAARHKALAGLGLLPEDMGNS